MSSRKTQDGDERFLRVQKDPRFWEMPERERKIKIDKRFQSMFHDKRFKVKYTVDKRGRPINCTSTEDLKRFYKLSDSEEEADEEDARTKKKKKAKENLVKSERDVRKGKEVQSSSGDAKGERGVRVMEDEGENDVASGSDEESSADLEEDSDSEPDLARGKGNIETSSDEDDDDEEEEDVGAVLRREEEEIEHDWGELCKDAPRSDEVSARLAVCNVDWDRLKAKDLLVLFSSFIPKGGAVLTVKIYPSEFGKERLKMEEVQGPMEVKALPDDSEDDTEEERVYRERMRDYQFKRLKYYYAVVECDSADTATKIYGECDGYEYESSCSVLDLRFVPDEVTFDEEPKDVATDANLSTYTPKLFTSSATATSKVQLTWDETDHERVATLNRKFNKDELLKLDFDAYLASSSGEEDEEEEVQKKPVQEEKKKSEEQISKYRELLKGIRDKETKLQEDRDMEMEVTWVPGLKEVTEQLVKKKMEDTNKLTPWEEFLQKKKEKKKQKKSQRKQVSEEELSDDELPPDVDLRDPFFAEELGATGEQYRLAVSESPNSNLGKKRKEEDEEELEKQKAEMALLMEDDAKRKHFNYDKIVEQQNLSKNKRKKLLKKSEELLEDDDLKVKTLASRPCSPRTCSTLTRPTPATGRPKPRRASWPRSSADVRRQERDTAPTVKKSLDPSLSLLVKSIKSKTEQFQARKKQTLL
uniref:ESF1 RRM domain-containing protein n=1 Tax=Monopterus albus TaxID=43700 RepID=A0A3Q3IXS3_MONAL